MLQEEIEVLSSHHLVEAIYSDLEEVLYKLMLAEKTYAYELSCYPEKEEQYITVAEKGDYSDFQVPVNLMYEGQKFLSVFSHEHCAPTDIEYARLDEQDNRKGFLEYMKKTLYEKSFVTGPGRDKERFDEILSKLEKVWNQYPDLRLGQLLVIVCGKSDLFMIEDEELLERLQYNQFPIE